MAKKKKGSQPEVVGFLGVGLDNEDGHRRVTRSEEFLLLGGSADTHENMQETAIRFGEALRRKGKTLRETSADEALDLLRESMEH
jgi:hypothetical protein